MTLERVIAFGAAWNSGDADLVASFFADDGVYHAAMAPSHMGQTFRGRAEIRRGVAAFFDDFPDGKFENLRVVVAGNFGSFKWDFLATNENGATVRAAGHVLLTFRSDRVVVANAFPKARQNEMA